VLALPLAFSASAYAQDEARQPDDARAATPTSTAAGPFKFTSGRYFYGGGNADGTDLNLRWRRNATSAWIGWYGDGDFGSQTRVGMEHALTVSETLPLSVQLSGQIATRGFAGGSVTLEYGEPWFVAVGVGRTNGKPYVNLNFDPNDAWIGAAGWRASSGLTAYLLAVRDNRYDTRQQNMHAVLRMPLPGRQRLTIDIQRKTGLGPLGQLADWGASLTWDVRDFSVRLAYDRKQNFSTVDAIRFSLAWRF
jgi:hypothetical protein